MRAHLVAPIPERQGVLQHAPYHERTGRPLGSPEFVAGLERELGRPLAPGRPGRKPGGRGK